MTTSLTGLHARYGNFVNKAHVKYATRTTHTSAYLDRVYVLRELTREESKYLKTPALKMLFKDLSKIIDIALEPDDAVRMKRAQTEGVGLIRVAPSGQVDGPGDLLIQHIREAQLEHRAAHGP